VFCMHTYNESTHTVRGPPFSVSGASVGPPAETLCVSRTSQTLLAETEAAYELESRMGTPIDFDGVRSTEVNNGLLRMRRGGVLSVRPGIRSFQSCLQHQHTSPHACTWLSDGVERPQTHHS
jgi:hypothetical protein